MTINKLYRYYSEYTLKQLAEQSIQLKDYETLKNISKSHIYIKFIGLESIFISLDLTATQIILQHTNFIDKKTIELAFQNTKIFNNNLNDDWKYIWKFECNDSAKEKAKNITYYILDWKLSQNLTLNMSDINALKKTSLYSIRDFLDTHPQVKGEELLCKSYHNAVQALTYEMKENSTSTFPMDICLNNKFGPILSRTYSNKINVENAQYIYKKIYDSSIIGKAIISYVNKNILLGDDIVIIFTNQEDVYSTFDISDNAITISLNNQYLPTETITVHELAHYVIEAIFQHNGIPSNICNSFKKHNLSYIKQEESKPFDVFLSDISHHRCSNSQIFKFNKIYDDAAKDLLFKIADLLQIREQVKKYEEYTAQNFATYLAQIHPILSILFLDPTKKFEISHDISSPDTILHNTITNLMTIPEFAQELEYDIKLIRMVYALNTKIKEQAKTIKTQEQIIKKSITEYKTPYLNTDNLPKEFTDYIYKGSVLNRIQELLVNTYLPKKINKLNLSEDQIFFLSRAADLIYRDKFDFETEPVVRCVELQMQSQFIDISENILSACDKMNQFWQDYVFPHM